mgnify:CR=1 FL=1
MRRTSCSSAAVRSRRRSGRRAPCRACPPTSCAPPPLLPPPLQVGFGDVVPATAAETLVVIFVEVCGVLFFGLLISSIR